jgi:hypothetical protein
MTTLQTGLKADGVRLSEEVARSRLKVRQDHARRRVTFSSTHFEGEARAAAEGLVELRAAALDRLARVLDLVRSETELPTAEQLVGALERELSKLESGQMSEIDDMRARSGLRSSITQSVVEALPKKLKQLVAELPVSVSDILNARVVGIRSVEEALKPAVDSVVISRKALRWTIAAIFIGFAGAALIAYFDS